MLGVFALPLFVSAQASDTIGGLGDTLIGIINETLVPLIFAAAFLVFIWGVFQYFILSKGSDDGQEKGRNLMIYGLIGFFVMVSVWGIINLLVGTFGLDAEDPEFEFPDAPTQNR